MLSPVSTQQSQAEQTKDVTMQRRQHKPPDPKQTKPETSMSSFAQLSALRFSTRCALPRALKHVLPTHFLPTARDRKVKAVHAEGS